MQNQKRKILVYGSLRFKEYNYNAFKRRNPDGINYLKTTTINGFKLYDLGSYPGIKISSNNEPLVVDVMEVDRQSYESIYRMEIGANYTAETVTLDGEPHTIYVYQGNPSKLVESGDWSKYLSHEQEIEA